MKRILLIKFNVVLIARVTRLQQVEQVYRVLLKCEEYECVPLVTTCFDIRDWASVLRWSLGTARSWR